MGANPNGAVSHAESNRRSLGGVAMRSVKYLGYFFSAFGALTITFTSAKAQEKKYALRGTLVTPDQVIANGTI